MDPIVQHPAVSALSLEIRPRSRLKQHHRHLFDERNRISSEMELFDELALVVCGTGVVCRKELFETYAAATYVHAKFPRLGRVADLAAGHGLLSWFLLVLDLRDAERGAPGAGARTAVCVDRRMPPAAEAISEAMVARFPELGPRWSYVQADLTAVVPHPSCLLTSVHACGTLSDRLIGIAIDAAAPFAIVPCCHTVRERKGYRPHPLSGMDAGEVVALVEERKREVRAESKHQAVADVVDEVRCRTLKNAGYDVEVAMLPEEFTARNRLLLGEREEYTADCDELLRGGDINENREFFRRRPNEAKEGTVAVRIPLANDPESVAHCHSISGKVRAVTRLIEEIPRHFSLALSLSIWLTREGDDPENGQVPTVEILQTLADGCCGEIRGEEIMCAVEVFGDVYVQPVTGRLSQLYRFNYKKPEAADISTARVSRTSAKAIHGVIRERIIKEFGNLLR